MIETIARRPVFQVPEERIFDESEESALTSEVKGLQRAYEAYTTKGGVQGPTETQIAEMDTLTAVVKMAKSSRRSRRGR